MFSCCDCRQSIYYYIVTRESDTIGFRARRFDFHGDTIYMRVFVHNGQARLVNGGRYLRKGNSMYRFESPRDSVGQCYFILQKDTSVCFNVSDPRLNPILKTCYRFIKDTSININNNMQDVYMFERELGNSGVLYNVYFRPDFVPVKEEYVHGFSNMYDIELLEEDKVPREFKRQVRAWKKK